MAEANPDTSNTSAVMRSANEMIVGDSALILPSIATLQRHHKIVAGHLNEFSLEQIIGNFVPNSISPSTKPFKCLKKVSLRDLSIDKHSEGNYVLVRILEPGFQVIGWLWVIEDELGNGCILNVCNFPPLELPCVGTVLIVKEPFLTVTTLEIPLIRCDCPTDIIVLRRSHSLYHIAKSVLWRNKLGKRNKYEVLVLNRPLNISARRWINYGLSLVRRGCWSLAVECYLLALIAVPECSPRLWVRIHSRLCLAYLCLGYYEKTIATAGLIPHDRLALLSAGRAYYRLRKYQDAKRVFEMLISSGRDDYEAFSEYHKSLERLREQASGFWNIERLKHSVYMTPDVCLEYGDFVGPVRVVDIPGKGRGLQLTHDVPPETILIVSKAFASTINSVQILNPDLKHWLSLRFPVNDLELEAEIAQAIMRNPNTFGETVYDLSTSVSPPMKVQVFCDSGVKDEPICDMVTIQAIRNYNAFNILPERDGRISHLGQGLFIMPSYLNHSCEPNVFATFYNDVMVIRSIGHLKSGVELCITYVGGVNANDRRNEIRRAWSFECLCPFCLNS